jgi:ParB-like chromosome segregation protein Spo0J
MSVRKSSPVVKSSEIETWPIDRLKPYAGNARVHPPEQIRQLRASFRKFGQVWPILVDADGTIIAGHGRLQAAKREKMTEVSVIIAKDWDERRRREFALLDNRVPMNAEWDEDRLNVELSDLALEETNLGILGFSDREIERALKEEDETASSAPQLTGLAYSLVIRCKDETHQTELLERFEEEGLQCEVLMS